MILNIIETRNFAFIPFINYGEHGLIMGWMWWRIRPEFGHTEDITPSTDNYIPKTFSEPMEPLSEETAATFVNILDELTENLKESQKEMNRYIASMTDKLIFDISSTMAQDVEQYVMWKEKSEDFILTRRYCRRRALKFLLRARAKEDAIEALKQNQREYEQANQK